MVEKKAQEQAINLAMLSEKVQSQEKILEDLKQLNVELDQKFMSLQETLQRDQYGSPGKMRRGGGLHHSIIVMNYIHFLVS